MTDVEKEELGMTECFTPYPLHNGFFEDIGRIPPLACPDEYQLFSSRTDLASLIKTDNRLQVVEARMKDII